MNDLDLDDLESQLYSQVYHGANDENEENLITIPTISNLSEPADDMRKPSARYFGPWSSSRTQNKNVSSKPNNTKGSIKTDFNKPNNYSKNYNKALRPDITFNQVVVVGPQSPIPVVCLSAKQYKKEQWKAKWKAKKKQFREKMKEREMRRKQKKILKSVTTSVITVSDSEDDSCVIVEDKSSVQEAKKDSETKSTIEHQEIKSEGIVEAQSDDVIFIEPAPIEVINIDDDVSSLNKTNVETSSSTSENSVNSSSSKKELHKERKELLSTPDSASNDFMSNSGVDLIQENFNFSLHGSDFNSGQFAKPLVRNETCETESSSSTTDINSVNLMKTVVFNEVDFPKDDIFSENNLESFGNFITPLRSNLTSLAEVQSSPIRVTEAQNPNAYTDSSSESDLDESQVDSQKTKKLPELSPMVMEKEAQVDKVFTSKKSKVTLNMGSKYDLLDDSSVKEAKQKNSKKKKKNKKKKNSESANDNNEQQVCEKSVAETEAENVNVEEQLKQKKRKSSQMEGSTDCENQQNKKAANDHIVSQNSETDEKVSSSEQIKSSDLTEKEIKIKQEPEDGSKESAEIRNRPKASSSKEVGSNPLPVAEKNKEMDESFIMSHNSTLDGLTVVDEVGPETTVMLSSDSEESVLSALHEEQDIQLNCEEKDKSLETECKDNNADKFNVKEIQLSMSNDPNLWQILDSDKMPSGRSQGRRCNRCRQFGHVGIRCPNKVEPKCTLCGGRGHYEPRCPNKICTQCGQKSPYSTTYCNSCFKYRHYVCRLCSLVGHHADSCPDLWRRYHLTTSEGPLVTYDGPELKDKSQLWCSGCAQAGHLEHDCRFYKSIYPPSDPFIKSYDDIYQEKTKTQSDRTNKDLRNNLPLNQTINYNMNNSKRTCVFQEFDQRNMMGYNFNQNNFGHLNQQFGNIMDGVFMANQQNFFQQGSIPVFNQFPQNNQFIFGNTMPNFINVDAEATSSNNNNFRELPNVEPSGLIKNGRISKIVRRQNSMFFSSSARQLYFFINSELHRLSKLSMMSNKVANEMKKRRAPRRGITVIEEYYETLNMLLFGVFNFFEGKMHLERLKQFKREGQKYRVNNATRKQLHRSYCYIFGRDKHNGVDYGELLRQI